MCMSQASSNSNNNSNTNLSANPRIAQRSGMPPRRASSMAATSYPAPVEDSSSDSDYCGGTTKRRRKRSSSNASKKNHPHIITKHNYHDHATDPIRSTAPLAPRLASSQNKGGITVPFPMKLYDMLERMDLEGLAHVVSWQPHGRCFVVHDASAFKEILPNYFKLSKIPSFQRQLNLYGFQRLTVGTDKGGYYNELFLRGRPDLCSRIQRVKVKGTGVRAKSNPRDEPNLYQYPAVDAKARSNLNRTVEAQPKTSSVYPTTTLVSQVSGGDTVETLLTTSNLIPPMETVSSPIPDSIKIGPSGGGCTPLSSHFSRNMLDVKTDFPEPAADGPDSFDRLIDEMFRHDQSLDFADLLKLAAV